MTATTGDRLADRVDDTLAARPGGLRRGSVAFPRALALSVGIQGPTAGVIIGPAIIAGIVGAPGGLAQVGALVAMAFVAYAFVTFTRSFNTAGSVYAFNGTALGPAYGFVSAWLLLTVYLGFAAGVYASTADIAGTLLASAGLPVWWGWLALAGAAFAVGLAYASIGVSSLVILVLEGASILLITAVGVTVVLAGGYHHHALSAAPFTPHGVGLSVLALGVVGAFGQFSGFEGAATLGEETRHATRAIPAAVAASLAISAAVYIFFTWIVYSAYPSPAAVAADPAPLVHVADVYLSPGVGTAVNVAGVVSAFGAQLALLNAAARLTFALGRELGATRLTRVSPRTGAPVGALAAVAGFSVAGLAAFAAEPTAARAATLLIQYGAYLLLVAYALTVVAALVWTWRTTRRPLPLTVLTVGVAVIGCVLYRTFHPFPAAPFDRVVLAATATAALGVAAAGSRRVRTALRGSALLAVTTPATGHPDGEAVAHAAS